MPMSTTILIPAPPLRIFGPSDGSDVHDVQTFRTIFFSGESAMLKTQIFAQLPM